MRKTPTDADEISAIITCPRGAAARRGEYIEHGARVHARLMHARTARWMLVAKRGKATWWYKSYLGYRWPSLLAAASPLSFGAPMKEEPQEQTI